MTIDGVYYTEPELMAKFRQMQETIQRLDGENYKLTERIEEVRTALNDHVDLVLWHEEREKEYKRLLKAAVEDMRWVNENTQDADGTCIMRNCEGCGDCPLDINGDLWCKWKYEADALKLIGGEEDVD